MENKDLLSDIAKIDKATEKTKSFIYSLVDANSFVETDVFMSGKNFDDAVEALGEGVVTGYATIEGKPVQIFAQNSEVLKGSLSAAHAEKITKCMERAISTSTPLVSIIDSYGARVGDGASIMEGYAKIIKMSTILSDEVPHICIVKGVATGMMTAFAASADFTFMSKDAVMSVNSPMYLMSSAKAFPVDYKASLGFDAYKKNSDVAQFTYKTEKDLKAQLNSLLSIMYDECNDEEDADPNAVNPNLEKASAVDAIKFIADDNSILDYCPEYASDVRCAFAKLNKINVGFIATSGEHISIDGLKKATAFVNKLSIYNIPLITLVDTKGIDSTLNDELSGVAKTAYDLMAAVADSSNAKIGVAFGNAIGYGYSALMSKNIGFEYTLATTKAKISPVSEEVAVAMMCDQLKAEDRKENLEKLSQQYADMQLNPIKAAKDGYIDNVVEATNLRPYIASALLMLMGI